MSGARLLLNKVTVHHFLLNDSLLDNLHRRDIFILMGSMLLHLFRLGLISVHGVCLEVVLLHLKKRLHNFTCFLLYKSMMKRIGVFGLRTRNFIGEFRMLSVCLVLLVCRPDRWYCRNWLFVSEEVLSLKFIHCHLPWVVLVYCFNSYLES